MNLLEAVAILHLSRELVIAAIEEGLETPRSKTRIRLIANQIPGGYDISQEDLDTFISAFEAEEPGRHPPAATRRELLIESRYKCAVCDSDAPLEFHHIIEWARIQHHDPAHMLAVCANCHEKITRYGHPDATAQKQIKDILRRRGLNSTAPLNTIPTIPPQTLSFAPQPSNQPFPATFSPPQAQSIPKGQPSGGNTAPLNTIPTIPPQTLSFAPQPSNQPFPVTFSPPQAQSIPKGQPSGGKLEKTFIRIFRAEIERGELAPDAIADESAKLFSQIHPSTGVSADCILLLRVMRCIAHVQQFSGSSAGNSEWTYTTRLLEATANVLAAKGHSVEHLTEIAETSLGIARAKRLLEFKQEDEWRPGMRSGSGWVEYASLSLIGETLLERAG